jgi:hypothetical protein
MTDEQIALECAGSAASIRLDRMVALLFLERLADGSPAKHGRWEWSEYDYDAVRAAILDTDLVAETLSPLRAAALRAAVVHALCCAEWHAEDVAANNADDDGRLALEAALDALPFLCPPVRK